MASQSPSPPPSYDWQQLATTLLSPTPTIIALTLVTALTLPILFHLYLYHTAPSQTGSNLPTILLAGPSNSGKTTLLTLLATGSPSETHTSQTPQSALCKLPQTLRSKADRYRSENDTSARERPQFLLLDTPGHGKLRHHAFAALADPASSKQPEPAAVRNLRGLVFVADSAACATQAGLTATAEYLHHLLLRLQKRHTRHPGSKPPAPVPVLVAAGKQDVFTALPAGLVGRRLEEEVGRVRESRSRGVVGVEGEGEAGAAEDEAEWLGEFGEGRAFEFRELEQFGVEVRVVGGSGRGEGESGVGVQGWWDWIAEVL
ncbi:hypothetical protein MBLNU230_g3272t1 [Neophaeotheca triangularis]